MLKDFKFHHVGYAVKDIDKATRMYKEMGFEIGETMIDPIQNTKNCFAHKDGFPLIEFVAPVDENSPINKTLEKSGNTPYHCCYEVENMEQALEDLKPYRFIKLFNPVPAVAIDNHRICYLFNRDNGLIELVEK